MEAPGMTASSSYAHVVSGPVQASPPVPPVALCFGCLHSFPTAQSAAGDDPTAMMRASPFGDALRRCLHDIRTHAARVEPLTDRSREAVSAMEDQLKRLVVLVDDELTARQKHADKLAVQLKYYSEWESDIQKQLRIVLMQQQEDQRRSASQQQELLNSARSRNSSQFGTGTSTSHLLERFIASARSAAPEVRPASAAGGQSLVTNRYGAPISRIPRRPDGASNQDASAAAAALPSMSTSARNRSNLPVVGRQKGMAMDEATTTVFNSVSTALYQMLEGLAVTTRAAIGILWLNTDDAGEELTAPFLVVGRNDGFSRKGMSAEGGNATRVGATSSTAGAVAQTGIAVSIRRPRGSGAEETLQQALVSTVRSTLIVPVFRKFHEADRVCDGSLQLIAWANGAPFTPDDEYAAVCAANLVSHIVSNYSKAFRATWSVRPPFDPAHLRRYASYNAALDQAQGNVRDAVTTAAAVGHAGGGGTKIHRCDFGHAPVGSTKAIMKKELTKAGEAASTSLVAPKDAVRDLQKYTHTLEASWKTAEMALVESEKRVTDLQRQLDLAKQHGIIEGRQHHHNHRPRTAASTFSVPDTQAASMSPASAAGRDKGGYNSEGRPPSKEESRSARDAAHRRQSAAGQAVAAAGLTNMKLDDLEAETRNRMRTAAGARSSQGKSTVFLTQQ